jgi:hypothetical protein
VLSALTVDLLAQDPPQQTGPDFGKASPFGLIVVVVLLIAVFALVWSMNRHLNKLPKSFDEQGADPDLTTENPVDPGAGDRDR